MKARYENPRGRVQDYLDQTDRLAERARKASDPLKLVFGVED
jgi:hypothetical protein